jgi:hypothetical protein
VFEWRIDNIRLRNEARPIAVPRDAFGRHAMGEAATVASDYADRLVAETVT